MKKSILIFFCVSVSITNAQWEMRINGLPNWSVANILSIGNDGTIAAYVRVEDFPPPISISTNYAESWNNYATPEMYDGSDVCALDSINIWFCTWDGKIYYSSDVGMNWNLQFEDTVDYTFFNYIKFFDEQNGVAVGDAALSNTPAPIYKTIDGGIKWVNVNDEYLIGEVSRDQFYPISFPSVDVGYYFGSRNHKLYKTNDGGENWTVLELPDAVTDVYMLEFYDENLGMFVQDNWAGIDYIYRTTDGGISWIKLDLTSNTGHHDIEFLPGNPEKVWFTDFDNLYFSGDTGTSWIEVTELSNDLLGRNIEFYNDQIGILLCDENKLYFTSNNGGIVSSISNDEAITDRFELFQNYPNPFNPVTNINFIIVKSGFVTLKIYDILGREVKTLINANINPGYHSVKFDGSDLSSGIYLYRLETENFAQTKKLILLK